MLMMSDVITPPHSSSLILLTPPPPPPPQKSGPNGLYITTDIQNYLDRGQCYLPKPKAEADNIDRGLNNSGILRKPNSIIVLLFIL
jgi:hypothetical protein